MMVGRIIKAYSGFYYVYCDKKIFTCVARGLFRKKNIKPLVGDIVEFDVDSFNDLEGNIVRIFDRKNRLLRLDASNVDQVFIVFSYKSPDINYSILDKYILSYKIQNIDFTLCISKSELLNFDERNEVISRYGNIYKLLFISNYLGEGIDEFKSVLDGKLSLLTGPSGVGKSSLLNNLLNNDEMKVGEIGKNKRGKQTTRHYEIKFINDNSMIMDTPGFTSLDIELDERELKNYYDIFNEYKDGCRFKEGCLHINEPSCNIKNMVKEGIIPINYYDSYVSIFNELSEKNKKYNRGRGR